MKAAATVAALSALALGVQQARAQDPFRPVPVAPPCNTSVTRGAQEALDGFMAGAQVEVLKKQRELESERQRLRAAGESTVGVEARRDTAALFDRYDLQRKLDAKVKELTAFALKKYKCEPVLFYFVP